MQAVFVNTFHQGTSELFFLAGDDRVIQGECFDLACGHTSDALIIWLQCSNQVPAN